MATAINLVRFTFPGRSYFQPPLLFTWLGSYSLFTWNKVAVPHVLANIISNSTEKLILEHEAKLSASYYVACEPSSGTLWKFGNKRITRCTDTTMNYDLKLCFLFGMHPLRHALRRKGWLFVSGKPCIRTKTDDIRCLKPSSARFISTF